MNSTDQTPKVIDTEHRDTAICPGCGFEHRCADDLFEGTNGDDGTQVHCMCYKCDTPYVATRHVTVTYTTAKLLGDS